MAFEGTTTPPSNYPDPVLANVNMHSMSWAYGVGNATMDKTGPAAPVLSSSAKTTTTVTLNWTVSNDSGSGISGYNVFNGSTKVNSSVLTVLTLQVTGLTTGTAYNFKVVALDGSGNTTDSNVLAVTTN